MTQLIAVICLTVIVSVLLATGLIHYGKFFGLIDIPNARSAHSKPTVRGGGFAIVLPFILVGALCRFYLDSPGFFFDNYIWEIVVIGGGFVALVGLLDDMRGAGVTLRLVVHLASATVCVGTLDRLPEMPILQGSHYALILTQIAAVFAITWSVNLFNFMDGINGIAGFEFLFVALAGASILAFFDRHELVLPLLILSASVASFLFFNFPTARLFMGDVGSGFLGYVVAVFAIYSASDDSISPWSWVILYGYFICDATATLLRRLVRREPVWRAHTSHLYQRLARAQNSHVTVTLTIGALNLLWLLPFAILATAKYEYSELITIIALAPILIIACRR